ncbi:MAG: bifunctional riboflavin kinase/FAD synthetase [Anaerostipes sp.]|nr:bifunctional riboflavin kinase/FAD synthetase [Anaerostipes sp.]
MEYVHQTEDFKFENTVVALGKFDGLHKGHQLIFDELLSYKGQGLKSVVFSFDRPPAETLKSENYRVIYTKEEKAKILTQIGIDVLIEHPFTKGFSHLSPEDFVIQILIQKVGMKVLVVGDDCGFGYKRRGNVQVLQKLSKEYDFKLIVIPKLKLNGDIISSTRIRNLLSKGKIEEANDLMPSPFLVAGPVVHGNNLGKQVLGIPTANQVPNPEKLLPPNGVYISRIRIKEHVYYGVSNIGYKPTIEGKKHMGIETFIIDFDRDIYHKKIVVELLHFKRPEMKFDSLEDLGNQMNQDIGFAKKYIEQNF